MQCIYLSHCLVVQKPHKSESCCRPLGLPMKMERIFEDWVIFCSKMHFKLTKSVLDFQLAQWTLDEEIHETANEKVDF